MEDVLDRVAVDGERLGANVSPYVTPTKTTRPLAHAISEFSQGIQLMAHSDTKADIGALVKELVTAVHEEGQKQGSLKVHPLIYANLVFIAGLIFSSAVLYQRINELERRQYLMQGVEGMAPKVES